MPKVIVAIHVQARIIDLTDPQMQATLPLPWSQFMADWRADNRNKLESLSQTLGRAAFAAGVQGLLVPSKPDPRGVNMVIFLSSTGDGATIKLLDPGALNELGRN
jgi:RES domain-containing protein